MHELLKVNGELDSINYFSMEKRMECVEDQLKRVSQSYQENRKLKEKVVLLQQSKGHPNKETIEEINKLKKKVLILKRKVDEMDCQRRE